MDYRRSNMVDFSYYTYEKWKDIIGELDAHANLDKKSQDFIISLVEKTPKYLSVAQVKWIEDLKERYLQ
jgi:hypothetical protein